MKLPNNKAAVLFTIALLAACSDGSDQVFLADCAPPDACALRCPCPCPCPAATPSGRNRSAAFGTASTSLRLSVTTLTVAVMPGLSLRSSLFTSITAS